MNPEVAESLDYLELGRSIVGDEIVNMTAVQVMEAIRASDWYKERLQFIADWERPTAGEVWLLNLATRLRIETMRKLRDA